MNLKTKARRKPKITVSAADYMKLSALATAALDRLPEVADELLAELDRANVVADASVPDAVVQMGSSVTYKPDTGEARTVTLVFPGDADIAEGKVSVMTPIGTALIGLSAGQTMSWTARDGRRHELVVEQVTQPGSVPLAPGRAVELESASRLA